MDDTPDPAEVIADAMHAFCTGRYSTAENAVEDLLHILEAEGYRIVRTDPDPDETQEAWLNDACSVIGNHCGSDGSDDDHNDWIGDLAHALWDTLGDGPLVERIAEVVAERDALAARLDKLRAAIEDHHELVDAIKRADEWAMDDDGFRKRVLLAVAMYAAALEDTRPDNDRSTQ